MTAGQAVVASGELFTPEIPTAQTETAMDRRRRRGLDVRLTQWFEMQASPTRLLASEPPLQLGTGLNDYEIWVNKSMRFHA